MVLMQRQAGTAQAHLTAQDVPGPSLKVGFHDAYLLLQGHDALQLWTDFLLQGLDAFLHGTGKMVSGTGLRVCLIVLMHRELTHHPKTPFTATLALHPTGAASDLRMQP